MSREKRKALVHSQRRQIHRLKIRRAAKGIGNVIFVCLMVLVGTLLFFLVQSKLTGGQPNFAGYRLYAVLSGSMNPAFDTGSLVAVKPVDPAELQEGDIITFGSSGGKIVSHRIVGIEAEDGLSFVTKGDANNVADSGKVPASRVIGVVSLAIPWLGRLLVFSQSKQGLLTLIIIPALVILVLEGRELWSYAVQMDKERAAKVF
ncbi:MAG: signal peptidase I [Eubacteriales bacterium]|nr:signal peptidase I [Eubacteriales bacterium]MDD3072912.1 signal peptidase I [Eubacteriales bacterium]